MSRAWMLLGSASLLALLASEGQAHFVWVGIGRFQPVAEVWFNERPEPGDAHLLDRIRQTQAWVRTADGRQQPLKLERSQEQADPAWVAALAAMPPRSVEATCHYGVFARGERPRLLTYYAKHLDLDTSDPRWAALAHSPSLELDIEPRPSTSGTSFTVWWQGRPAPGVEVAFYSGDDEPQMAKTDSSGRVQWNKPLARLAVRAGLLDPDRRGKLNNQPYDGAMYYSTLTMTGLTATGLTAAKQPAAQQPAERQASAAEPVAALDAPAALKRARDSRAVWRDFPGFRAQMTVEMAGYQGQGELLVTPEGSIELAGFPAGGDLKHAEGYLESLVQHRLADAGADENVEFVEENEYNPLGRLLRFKGDERLKSSYRIRGDVITEVNREIGDTRFTISVLDIYRTSDGKYLPQVFNVGFWKKPAGTLERTETHVNHWVRVGRFELPVHLSVLRDTAGGGSLMVLGLSGHQLGVGDSKARLGRGQ